MLWVCVNRRWGPMSGPSGMIVKLCFGMFPQEMFPSYTAQVTWEFSRQFSSPVHSDYTYLIPQFSHSSFFINIHFPHVKKVLRAMAQALEPPMLKRQTENVGVFPVWLLWTPNLHLSLSVEILVMEQGVPASVFLPGSNRVPEVQTVSIIVRWAQGSRNPGHT